MSNDSKNSPGPSAMDAPDTEIPETEQAGERIAKRLARAGLCSRRDAERWIAEGRVALNGTVLDSPAVTVTRADRITVDGQLVPDPEPTRVFRYYKPLGLVTTARDEKGRETVFDALPEGMPRVVSVGRLDLTSEGLLLLTNDGELARHLELPSTGWLRRYRVRVHGNPTEADLHKLKDGVFVDGIEYGPIDAELDRVQGSNAWLTVGLREGKNREVRKVMEYLGLPVSRLIRVAYGPFQLGKLEEGAVEEIPRRILRDQLPAFFPKEERREVGSDPVRLRFDRLPKSSSASAPPSATKGGGRGEERRPNARMARVTVDRALQDPASRPPARERPSGSADWRDEKPRGRFADEEPSARPRGRTAGPRQQEEEGGIRVRTTRGGNRARPGFETQRATAAKVAAHANEPPREREERPARPARPPRAEGGRASGPGERTFRTARPEGSREERPARPPRGEGYGEGRPARAPRDAGAGGDRPARASRAGGYGEERPARAPRGEGYGADRPARAPRGEGSPGRPGPRPDGGGRPGSRGDGPRGDGPRGDGPRGEGPRGEGYGGRPGPRGEGAGGPRGRGPASGGERTGGPGRGLGGPGGPGRGAPGARGPGGKGPGGPGRGGPGGKGPGGGMKPGGRGADRRR